MTFGEKLLFLRRQSGLSQEQIAEKLNVSRQAVHYAVKNAEEKIQRLESQLHMIEKYETLEKKLITVRDAAESGECTAQRAAEMLSLIINEL